MLQLEGTAFYCHPNPIYPPRCTWLGKLDLSYVKNGRREILQIWAARCKVLLIPNGRQVLYDIANWSGRKLIRRRSFLAGPRRNGFHVRAWLVALASNYHAIPSQRIGWRGDRDIFISTPLWVATRIVRLPLDEETSNPRHFDPPRILGSKIDEVD